MRETVRGRWEKVHNEELSDFYASTDVTRVIKSRWIRLVGYAARIDEMKREYIDGFCEEI
jgi:hypothetical protein